MSDDVWTTPPPLHRLEGIRPDLDVLVHELAARVAELEHRLARMAADALGAEAGPDASREPLDGDQRAQYRLAEAEREAEAILARARTESRALVDAVRQSLNEAVRRKDEEVLAAVGQSHERVLAVLEEKLRTNGQPLGQPLRPR